MKARQIVFIGLLTLTGANCGREPPAINIVFAESFVGDEFEIILDRRQTAQAITPTGCSMINVSIDGKGYVQTLEPFESWHRKSYCFADGMQVGNDDITVLRSPGYTRNKEGLWEMNDGCRYVFRVDRSVVEKRLAHKPAPADLDD